MPPGFPLSETLAIQSYIVGGQVLHQMIHGSLELWGMFILGMLLSMLKRATFAIRSGKYKSRREFFHANWDALLIRAVLGGVVFWGWYAQKDLIYKLLGYVGVSLSWELPVTHGTALVFGYFVDAMIDWLSHKIPWLRGQIPEFVDGLQVVKQSPDEVSVKVPGKEGAPPTEVIVKAPQPDLKEPPKEKP